MASPPRDNNGVVIPHDDPDLDNEDGLFRYIDPDNHLVTDCNTGNVRLSSGAFSETGKGAPYGGMSVDLEPQMNVDGIDPETRLQLEPWGRDESWGIVRLITGEMRKHNFKVGSDPIVGNPENPQHGEVWGIQKGMRKRAVKNDVMGHFEWVRRAAGVS